MTINEAVRRGIGSLRKPEWVAAHIELYLTRKSDFDRLGFASRGAWGAAPPGEGPCYVGPWIRLYDPPSHLAMGFAWDHYQELLNVGVDDADFEEWTEPADYGRYAAIRPAEGDAAP